MYNTIITDLFNIEYKLGNTIRMTKRDVVYVISGSLRRGRKYMREMSRSAEKRRWTVGDGGNKMQQMLTKLHWIKNWVGETNLPLLALDPPPQYHQVGITLYTVQCTMSASSVSSGWNYIVHCTLYTVKCLLALDPPPQYHQVGITLYSVQSCAISIRQSRILFFFPIENFKASVQFKLIYFIQIKR